MGLEQSASTRAKVLVVLGGDSARASASMAEEISTPTTYSPSGVVLAVVLMIYYSVRLIDSMGFLATTSLISISRIKLIKYLTLLAPHLK